MADKSNPNDLDMSWDSPHHTLGAGPTQAAAGNHTHKELARIFKVLAASTTFEEFKNGLLKP